jgi:hypothetical protein
MQARNCITTSHVIEAMRNNIQDLDGNTVYFPFLDLKSGKTRSLRSVARSLLTYCLISDRVLVPPRSLFSAQHVDDNLHLLQHPLFSHLLRSEVLISSATDPNARDVQDVVEIYAGSSSSISPAVSMAIYFRDAKTQKKSVHKHIISALETIEDLWSDEKEAILSVSSTLPDFHLLQANTRSELCGVAPFKIQLVESLLRDAYFVGGVVGNNAWMPQRGRRSNFLLNSRLDSPMYSPHFVRTLTEQIHRSWRSVSTLSPAEYLLLRDKLKRFRWEISRIAQETHQHCLHWINSAQKDSPYVAFAIPLVKTVVALFVGWIQEAIVGFTRSFDSVVKTLSEYVKQHYGLEDRASRRLLSIFETVAIKRSVYEIMQYFEQAVLEAKNAQSRHSILA